MTDESILNLHYSNLPDTPSSDPWVLMSRAFSNLRPFYSYLERAQVRMEQTRLRLSWESSVALDAPSKPSESSVPELRGQVNNSTWIRLKETNTENPEDDSVFDTFLESDLISDKERSGKGDIEILGTDPEKRLILVSRLPGGPYVYLHPNTYQMHCQRGAISILQESPLPAHRALLRLVEDVDRVNWPSVVPVMLKEDDWKVIDRSYPGAMEQCAFVQAALGTPDFAILEGPPGSGKTVTICELILQEIVRGGKVLLSASTHVAIDNVLENLLEGGWMREEVVAVRIGRESDVSESIHGYTLKNRVETEHRETVDKLMGLKDRTPSQELLLSALRGSGGELVIQQLILDCANLVCGTTIGILQHPLIKNCTSGQAQRYSLLIIDEASKTTFQEFLVPALFADRWVLVGDVNQLSPHVDEGTVEANFSGLLEPSDAMATLAPFLTKQYLRRGISSAVLSIHDKQEWPLVVKQAEAIGLSATVVDREKEDAEGFPLLSSNLFVTSYEELVTNHHLLPPDITPLFDGELPDGLARRMRYWRNRPGAERGSDSHSEDATTWKRETAWRLVRQFDLRQKEAEAQYYADQVKDLMPHWLSEPEFQRFCRDVETIRQIAFPSILELLQVGFRGNIGAVRTTLTDGFPKEALSSRLVALTYQHRMHPDISRFSRRHMYNEEKLLDSPTIEHRRRWTYDRYSTRVEWVQVTSNVESNVSMGEVEATLGELDSFISWAREHGPKDVGKGARWEVAVLTYYDAQALQLRKRLQRLYRTGNTQLFVVPDAPVVIRLGTVNSFQGREADIVFLSFVKNPRGRSRWIGFLDSPNRLNVAVTRARFQLVLIGNRKAFAQQRHSDVLRKLAEEVPSHFLTTSYTMEG